MSNEHGVTLGRLVAAERNALVALETVKSLAAKNNNLEKQVDKLLVENIEFRQQLSLLNAQIHGLRGSGSTER